MKPKQSRISAFQIRPAGNFSCLLPFLKNLFRKAQVGFPEIAQEWRRQLKFPATFQLYENEAAFSGQFFDQRVAEREHFFPGCESLEGLVGTESPYCPIHNLLPDFALNSGKGSEFAVKFLLLNA